MQTIYAIGDGFYDCSGETFRDLGEAADRPDDGYRHTPPDALRMSAAELALARTGTSVTGSYLSRLPLACVRAGLADYAEEWLWTRAEQRAGMTQPLFGYRTFARTGGAVPFWSESMARY